MKNPAGFRAGQIHPASGHVSRRTGNAVKARLQHRMAKRARSKRVDMFQGVQRAEFREIAGNRKTPTVRNLDNQDASGFDTLRQLKKKFHGFIHMFQHLKKDRRINLPDTKRVESPQVLDANHPPLPGAFRPGRAEVYSISLEAEEIGEFKERPIATTIIQDPPGGRGFLQEMVDTQNMLNHLPSKFKSVPRTGAFQVVNLLAIDPSAVENS